VYFIEQLDKLTKYQ